MDDLAGIGGVAEPTFAAEATDLSARTCGGNFPAGLFAPPATLALVLVPIVVSFEPPFDEFEEAIFAGIRGPETKLRGTVNGNGEVCVPAFSDP